MERGTIASTEFEDEVEGDSGSDDGDGGGGGLRYGDDGYLRHGGSSLAGADSLVLLGSNHSPRGDDGGGGGRPSGVEPPRTSGVSIQSRLRPPSQ